MKCEDYREGMADRLAGNGGQAEALRAHEKACAECAALLNDFRRQEEALSRLPVPAMPHDPWEEIEKRISRTGSRKRIPWGWAAAAVLCLVLGIGYLFPEPPRPEIPVEIVDVQGGAFDVFDGMIPGYGDVEAKTLLASWDSGEETSR